MTTLKGSKKEGAAIKYTKTWGYHVWDYLNTENGKPVAKTFKTLEEAEAYYLRVLSGERIYYNFGQ